MVGEEIYKLAGELFPICRSITGNGVRETLGIIKKYLPDLNIIEVESGTKVLDWEIPDEWNIWEAYIENSKGEKIIDFKNNNLHVLGYAEPIDKYMSLRDLKKIVYTQPEQPDVIPYVTSYYKRRTGFCMSENQLKELKEDNYHVYIDSDFSKGKLTYAELIIPGETKKEILLSSYICHPSMANNECSGPSLLTYVAREIMKKSRKYTYRIIFVPETIGTITYLHYNLPILKKNVIAGYNLSCVGDDRIYSFIASKNEDTLSEHVLEKVLIDNEVNYKKYSFLQRGSDEKQYGMPGIDLPIISFTRSKYGEYPEYHTSADNMSIISAKGFEGSFHIIMECLEVIEADKIYAMDVLGMPQLGKRNLYPSLSRKGIYEGELMAMLNLITYVDGKMDLLQVSERIHYPCIKLIPIANKLVKEKILRVVADIE